MVEVAFDLRGGSRPLELIIDDDLRACRLDLSEGPRVVGKEVGPFRGSGLTYH